MESISVKTEIKRNNTTREIDRMTYCLVNEKDILVSGEIICSTNIYRADEHSIDEKVDELFNSLNFDGSLKDQVIMKRFSSLRDARRAMPYLMGTQGPSEIDSMLENFQNLIKSDLMNIVTERVAGIKISENIK